VIEQHGYRVPLADRISERTGEYRIAIAVDIVEDRRVAFEATLGSAVELEFDGRQDTAVVSVSVEFA
jgi:recombinational DNA repair protein RecT